MLKSILMGMSSKEGVTFCYYNSLIKCITSQSVKSFYEITGIEHASQVINLLFQQKLIYIFAAKIGQHKENKASEAPFNCYFSAPAKFIVSPK